MDWKENILVSDQQIQELLRATKTIAVLGIKTESQSFAPAFYVPQYMHARGFRIIPVPVYYPEATEILGEKVYRRVSEIPESVDMVNVFRRSQDIPPHVEDILAARPKSVWLQAGIRHDEAARTFAEAGIKVVQDMCLMVEHRYL
jgi:predicted CoA-binding protein